jgi:hypothetical protein
MEMIDVTQHQHGPISQKKISWSEFSQDWFRSWLEEHRPPTSAFSLGAEEITCPSSD